MKQLFKQIGHFLCNIGFHYWKFSHDTGHNKYHECRRCGKRKVVCGVNGYQPIDRNWLKKHPLSDSEEMIKTPPNSEL